MGSASGLVSPLDPQPFPWSPTEGGLIMFVVNVRFPCARFGAPNDHFAEVCLPGRPRLATVYARLIAAAPCPRCLARKSAIDVARQILNDPNLRSDWLRPGQIQPTPRRAA
jgi:hypothetical protein